MRLRAGCRMIFFDGDAGIVRERFRDASVGVLDGNGRARSRIVVDVYQLVLLPFKLKI